MVIRISMGRATPINSRERSKSWFKINMRDHILVFPNMDSIRAMITVRMDK